MAEGKEEKHNIIIRLYGIVQSVGLRPFVERLARAHSITGAVRNSGGLLEIEARGTAPRLEAFYRDILEKKPKHALIVHSETHNAPHEDFNGFAIEKSSDAKGPVFLSPDICVCHDCVREMYDPKDARYRHPFISCMSCGPRYSIIEGAPYDRENTTMREFGMCPMCAREYADNGDRRFHAQTISCHECGPYLLFRDPEGKTYTREEAFGKAVEAVKGGGIIAVKGIGGYHLACSPYSEETVMRLREIKMRELKPFAVMFPDMESVKRHCEVSAREEALLESDARPIVLLEKGEESLAPAVCNKSRFVGAFLWYTPLQAMLLAECGPLVMTSANVSEDPIINDDEEMMKWSRRLDGILYNERKIAVRLDDSVVRSVAGKTQMIRRSRGYAPLPVLLPGTGIEGYGVFAAGGELKGSFCLASGRFAYPSQHLGDLGGLGNGSVYRETFERMKRIFRIEPRIAACDMHPGYESSLFARSLGLPLIEVQHHHAHIASVIAEHGLLKPVIGVAFDGTGYGEDGAVWGGEFLICECEAYRRAGHLKYVKFLGGDEGMRDAAKSALMYLIDCGSGNVTKDPRWPLISAAVENGVNTHDNSSMGRLFDAAAALLGACSYNRYEAECASALENLAHAALRRGIKPLQMRFDICEREGMLIADASPVIRALCENADAGAAALGFHRAAADMTVSMCERLRDKNGINDVALSGGVFQNTLLLEDTMEKLKEKGFAAYMNEAVPPNDAGICLGQAYIGLKKMEKRGTLGCA